MLEARRLSLEKEEDDVESSDCAEAEEERAIAETDVVRDKRGSVAVESAAVADHSASVRALARAFSSTVACDGAGGNSCTEDDVASGGNREGERRVGEEAE